MQKQTAKETNENILSKRDIRKSWWMWWLFAEVNNSFERMQGLSFCIAMIPILKKLYKKKEDFQDALKRHLQFFNTSATWGSIVHGITIALEEQKSKKEGDELPGETITSIKTGLMGPFAGIGDTIDWATWLPICIGLFIPLAKSGSWIAGLAPLLIFAIITIFEGYTLSRFGYRTGTNSATTILKSGMIKQLILAASILGLMMMGGLAASYVSISTPLVIHTTTTKIAVQAGILDRILKGMLPLLAVTGVYLYLEKVKRNYTIAMLIILVVGLSLGALGILK
ncbi:MAG: PTS system mannose/fructose/sorbose family transporter subunit IID [Sporolactobacillus sp.]